MRDNGSEGNVEKVSALRVERQGGSVKAVRAAVGIGSRLRGSDDE